MKILLFGKNGQLAYRLYIALLPLGSLIVYGSQELDFRNSDKIRECIRNHNPDVIINAAGYTEVDKAESESDVVFAINAEAVRVIAEEAANINAWLIHYSSEYVFDGTKNGSYTEEDIANPLNIYGKSKIAADEYIQSIAKKYIILRTSWVYDSYGKNFAKTILTLAQRNELLKVVDDQIGAPTNAAFDKLPKGTVEGLVKPEKKADLRNILEYHVYVGKLDQTFFKDGQVLGMVNGGKVTMGVKDGKVTVNGANIIASVPCSNGIIHVIDAVLLPPAKK